MKTFHIQDGDISDGYHTFDELYEHRVTLFIALCKKIFVTEFENRKIESVWKSKLHHDGSEYEGWFIMGIYQDKGSQISYHLPLSKWEETDFAITLEKAPEWDGHTSKDVLERLKNL